MSTTTRITFNGTVTYTRKKAGVTDTQTLHLDDVTLDMGASPDLFAEQFGKLFAMPSRDEDE